MKFPAIFFSLLISVLSNTTILAVSTSSSSPSRVNPDTSGSSTLMTGGHNDFRMAYQPEGQIHNTMPYYTLPDLNEPLNQPGMNEMAQYGHHPEINLHGLPPPIFPPMSQYQNHQPYLAEPHYFHQFLEHDLGPGYNEHFATSALNPNQPHFQSHTRNTGVRFRMNTENRLKRSRYRGDRNEVTSASPPDRDYKATPEGIWFPGFLYQPELKLSVEKQESLQVGRFRKFKSASLERVDALIDSILQDYSKEEKNILKVDILKRGKQAKIYFDSPDDLWEYTRNWSDDEIFGGRISAKNNNNKWVKIISDIKQEWGRNRPKVPKKETGSSSQVN